MKITKLKLLMITLASIVMTSQVSAQSSFKFYDDISLPQTDVWNFVRQGEVSPSLYTGTTILQQAVKYGKAVGVDVQIVVY